MPTTTTKTTPRKIGVTQANKNALRDAIAAMNTGSAERYISLFSPDARLHGFPQGIDDVGALAEFHAVTAGIYPDASVTLDALVAERDRIATRYTWRANQTTGVTLVAHGGAIVRFAGGRIAECWNIPAELAAVTSEDVAS